MWGCGGRKVYPTTGVSGLECLWRVRRNAREENRGASVSREPPPGDYWYPVLGADRETRAVPIALASPTPRLLAGRGTRGRVIVGLPRGGTDPHLRGVFPLWVPPIRAQERENSPSQTTAIRNTEESQSLVIYVCTADDTLCLPDPPLSCPSSGSARAARTPPGVP